MAIKTWSVYPSTSGRVFIEADYNCGMPRLNVFVVSDGHPPSAAWVSFELDDIPELRTALDNAIIAMNERPE